MKIEKRIHANCSEWDSEVESDYNDFPILPLARRKDIEKEIKAQGWDDEANK